MALITTVLAACASTISSGSDDSVVSGVKTLLGGNIYTVRKIISHYPHGHSNSETTLIVYESGDSGHTKSILCLFPPDFQLDGNLNTRKLDDMAIPPLMKRAREVHKQCGENHSCTYNILVKENAEITRATTWLEQRLKDESNNSAFAMVYRNAALTGKENEVLERGVIELVYEGIEDMIYKGEKMPTPELTGVKKVRIGKKAAEYAFGEIGYLCEKVE